VTASDEAFLWQVVTFYPSFWKKEEGHQKDDDSTGVLISVSSDGNQSVKAGPKRGFTDTAGKTMKAYETYVRKVGESREALNAKKWSDRLLLAARQVSNMKKKAAEQTAAPPVMTIAPRMDFLLYAPIVFEFTEDMKADDLKEFAETENAVTAVEEV
jgi:hypothetical protein